VIGRKGFTLLLALTVVVGLAAWGLRARSQPGAKPLPDRFLPGLAAQLNELTAVTVKGPSEQFTLRRNGDTWGLDEKDGHPIRFERLKGLLVGLSELRPIKRKTASPSLHGKLGLQPPSPDGSSVELVVFGAGGSTVADVIVGNPGPAPHTRYVRRADEDQTWLVQGDLTPESTLKLWLDTEVMRLDPSTVAKVTVTQPDGEVLVVDKQAKDDPVWTVENIPDGQVAKSAGVTNRLTAALQWLDFDDVAKASGHPLPETDRATAVFDTWDGMHVTVTAAREPAPGDGQAADASASSPEAAADAATKPQPPSAENWISITVTTDASASDEVRDKAAKLDATVSPWVYKLGEYQATTLRQRLSDLTQPKSAEKTAAPANGAPENTAPDATPEAAPANPPADSEPASEPDDSGG